MVNLNRISLIGQSGTPNVMDLSVQYQTEQDQGVPSNTDAVQSGNTVTCDLDSDAPPTTSTLNFSGEVSFGSSPIAFGTKDKKKKRKRRDVTIQMNLPTGLGGPMGSTTEYIGALNAEHQGEDNYAFSFTVMDSNGVAIQLAAAFDDKTNTINLTSTTSPGQNSVVVNVETGTTYYITYGSGTALGNFVTGTQQ